MLRLALPLLIAVMLATAARHREEPRRLPNGKSQTLAIVKDSHERSLKNVAEIQRLADELAEGMERDTEHVVSLEAIKKLARIEELARNIKNRMRRAQ